MKKLFLIVACLSLSLSCYAQQDNGGKALYESGKEKFKKYDDMQLQAQLGQTPDLDAMSELLLSGYADLMQALPLDSVPEVEKDGSPKIDKKTGQQKIKTKYSKDIVNLVADHHYDFYVVGTNYYQKEDYGNAAIAWDLYANIIPTSDYLGAAKPVVHDTIAGVYCYYAGLMYSQVANHERAMANFKKALTHKYDGQDVKDGLKYEYYTLVSNELEAKNYDGCYAILEDAIATVPDDAFYINYKGIVTETATNDIEQALPFYLQAIEVDPNLASAQLNVGRYYYNKAVNIMNAEENASLTSDQLAEKIDPIMKDAKVYIDRAVELEIDSPNPEAVRIKNWLDYQLGIE